jgi:hypothetical protein
MMLQIAMLEDCYRPYVEVVYDQSSWQFPMPIGTAHPPVPLMATPSNIVADFSLLVHA